MSNEISSLLLTIAGVSASFVAIIGGFVASRLITINSERDITKSELEKIRSEKFWKTEQLNGLRKSIDEEDAICYIHNHMEELISDAALDEIYEEDELQLIDYDTILPYWEEARIYMKLFDEHLHDEETKLNSDYIPCELAEEYTNKIFAYEFLKMYAGWFFSDYFENCEPMIPREWCESTRQQIIQTNTQIIDLNIQEQRYSMDLNRLKQPKGMKTGLSIFALFSMFNIIMPLFLSTVPLSEKWCTIIVYCSIGTLMAGLTATFLYLVQMLRWKE